MGKARETLLARLSQRELLHNGGNGGSNLVPPRQHQFESSAIRRHAPQCGHGVARQGVEIAFGRERATGGMSALVCWECLRRRRWFECEVGGEGC
jgi:hypothetical protein